MTLELDGSIRIAWQAEDFGGIRVSAPRHSTAELSSFAREVADVALLNRTVAELRHALRTRFGGTFDFETRSPAREPYIQVVLHPPRAEPNPDE